MPIYKSKNGHYYFIVSVKGKKYCKRTFNGKPILSKTVCKAAEMQFLQNLENQIQGKITLNELFNEYLINAKSTLKESTKSTYLKFEKNYLIFIDNKLITDLTPKDIMQFKSKLSKINATTQYKNRMLNILKSILEYGSIMYNLNGRLQFPLLESFKDNTIQNIDDRSKYLNKANFKLLLEPLDINNYYYIIIYTLYNTGLRIGELSALTKQDIKENYIQVTKDYIRVGGVDYIQTPKNKNSIRKVPISKELKLMLDTFCKDLKDDEIIFKREKEYLNQQKLRRVLARLQQAAGLTDFIITPHTLRHSYSSNLKNLGYNEFVIAALLGNTPKVATEVYIHQEINFNEISEKMAKIE